MAATAEAVGGNPTFPARTAALARPTPARDRMAEAIRALSHAPVTDARPRSRMPGGMPDLADVATVLWSRFHKFDAADPRWPDRDRFVLSAGRGAPLLYALLHLTGHDGIGLDDVTFGHEHPHPGIETAAGPPGQGFATAVGMALAERMLAARFGRSLVDHRTWVIAAEADLMSGISHEAASLAGQFRLEKLTVICPDDLAADGADTAKRFTAAGWAARQIDAADHAAIAAALTMATRSKKPTLLVARAPADGAPHVGNGARPCNGHGNGHGGGTGAAGAAFDDVAAEWRRVGVRGAAARRAWLKRLARHPQRPDFERAIAGRLPDAFHETLASLKAEFAGIRHDQPTHEAGERALAALAAAMPDLVGGAFDPAADMSEAAAGMGGFAAENYGGRFVPYGQRAHGMAAALNGMALHGGLIPCASSCLASTDAMRPALRQSAIMRQRVIHVLAADGATAAGGDGTHPPVEQLAGLRAMPNTHVFRPACALETVECFELALRRADGPSLLVLDRHPLPALRVETTENRCARGGYVITEADGPRQATLLASGAEVALALEARRLLAAEGIGVAVVSLPCWELFSQQDEAYRAAILGGVFRVGIEAACGFGWERWLGADGAFIGMPGFAVPGLGGADFGAAGAGAAVYKHFGITPDAVAATVRKRLGETLGARKD
jgi:transketolase